MADYQTVKPYIATDNDLPGLQEDQKELLLYKYDAKDAKCIWEREDPSKPFETIPEKLLFSQYRPFYDLLTNKSMDGFTHVVLDGHKFKKNARNQIVRSAYKEFTKKEWKPKSAPILDELFLGTVDEINAQVKKGDYTLPYSPIIIGDKIGIVKTRQKESSGPSSS